MASLTIRKLDDAIKAELRLRAARHGRSVEDEVRFILRDAATGGAENAAANAAPSPATLTDDPELRSTSMLRVLITVARGSVEGCIRRSTSTTSIP